MGKGKWEQVRGRRGRDGGRESEGGRERGEGRSGSRENRRHEEWDSPLRKSLLSFEHLQILG